MYSRQMISPPPRGRGAAANVPNRFERLVLEPEELPPDAVATEVLVDTSKSIIARNDSPDVEFNASINPYRGCEHGCTYCYARPSHEFLGFSAGLDFETKILAKLDAPELLRRTLMSPRWVPEPLGMSGITDPYQPLEKRLRLTRGCLEVLAELRHPVQIITKNQLITRDLDVLQELAKFDAVGATITLTTLDGELSRRMEPRAAHPRERLRTISQLAEAGIPTAVLVAPVVPALTDHELPALIQAAAEAGAQSAGYVLLRLPGSVREVFLTWLEEAYPDRAGKVVSRIRSLRDGKLNDTQFGRRGRGVGPFAQQTHALFEVGLRRAGLRPRPFALETKHFRRPGDQLSMFAESSLEGDG